MSQIPIEIKEKLLEIKSKLPEDKKEKFAYAIGKRLQDFQTSNVVKYTLVGGALGWLLEEIPIIGPSFGTELGLALGAWVGFSKDKKDKAERQRIAEAIQEAFNEAMA